MHFKTMQLDHRLLSERPSWHFFSLELRTGRPSSCSCLKTYPPHLPLDKHYIHTQETFPGQLSVQASVSPRRASARITSPRLSYWKVPLDGIMFRLDHQVSALFTLSFKLDVDLQFREKANQSLIHNPN